MKNLFKFSVLLLLFSCAKERPYQTVYKSPQLMKKSDVDTKNVFLYLPKALSAPREVLSAFPHYQGDPKLVQFRFSKDHLKIHQIETDQRFKDDPLNANPVLSIPVEYKDFTCQTDADQKCTNKEKENNDLQWTEKRYFIPDMAGLKIDEINKLNLFIFNQSCISKQESELIKYEMDKDVLNIVLENTYKINLTYKCLKENLNDFMENFGSAGFKARFMYSIVRLDQLASVDYQRVDYPIEDHSKFGFFTTKISKLDHTFSDRIKDTQIFLNRFNPLKKKIEYYLSTSFNKKENKILKDATFKAIENINLGLKKAQTNLQIELKEADENIWSGDLRYNLIQLVDGPIGMGLLGYGPSTVNPLSGEIVQAQACIYSAVLRSMTGHVYRSMVTLSKHRDLDNNNNKSLNMDFSANKNKSLERPLDLQENLPTIYQVNHRTLPHFEKRDDLSSKLEHKLAYLGKKAADPMEMIDIPQMAKEEFEGIRQIEGVVEDDGTLKKWTDLGVAQQKEVVKVILPKVYVHTLVHELGHNFGLRHNFMGSYDKDNFFTKEEAASLGLKAAPSFSSIMDYGYSDLNELSHLGKYDLAALRFAYSRSVETKEGDFVPLLKNLQETIVENDLKIHEYQYCTDENAGLSPFCNRFDEGTSLEEIANHFIRDYKQNYQFRNFRNKRDKFSSFQNGSYGQWMAMRFKRGRMIFEFLEKLYEIFHPFREKSFEMFSLGFPKELEEGRKAYQIINQARDASLKMASLFLEILKTPNLTCALALSDEPDKSVFTIFLEDIYLNALKYEMDYVPTSCFDPKVEEFFTGKNFVVRGEVGKYLNDISDPDPKHPYKSDLAVRGIWADKLLAIIFLSKRYLGYTHTEEQQLALMDMLPIRGEFMDIANHLIFNTPLSSPLPFRNKKGESYLESVEYNLHDQNSYVIPEQNKVEIAKFFNLPISGSVNLNKQILSLAYKHSQIEDSRYIKKALNFTNSISVYRFKNIDDHRYLDQNKQVINQFVYVAASENTLALKIIDKYKSFMNISPSIGNLSATGFSALSLDSEPLSLLMKVHSLPTDEQDDELTNMSQELKDIFALGKDKLDEIVRISQTIDSLPPKFKSDIQSKDELSANIHQFLSNIEDTILLLPVIN